MVITTRGSYGSMLYDGNRFYEQKPQLVEAVGTLGAGDSFAAAFLLSYIGSLEDKKAQGRADQGAFIKKAMAAGAEFAAKTCMVQGAFGYGRALV